MAFLSARCSEDLCWAAQSCRRPRGCRTRSCSPGPGWLRAVPCPPPLPAPCSQPALPPSLLSVLHPACPSVCVKLPYTRQNTRYSFFCAWVTPLHTAPSSPSRCVAHTAFLSSLGPDLAISYRISYAYVFKYMPLCLLSRAVHRLFCSESVCLYIHHLF